MRSGEHAMAVVSDISPAGISVSMPMPLSPGEYVQVEMADCILTGHAIHCNPEASRAGIQIERVQLGSTDLSELLQRTLCEAMPGTPGLEPQEDLAAVKSDL